MLQISQLIEGRLINDSYFIRIEVDVAQSSVPAKKGLGNPLNFAGEDGQGFQGW